MDEIKADPKKYILWSAENNRLEEVERLLRDDSSLVNSTDDDEYTPLHRAAYNGHENMIKLLVTNNADVNSRTLDGWQPFHSACRWNNVESAKLLIDLGSDVDSLTNGKNTALHLAACNGEAEDMIRFLLNETDINRKVVNNAGDTAEDVCRRNSSFYKLFRSQKCDKPDKSVGTSAGAACPGMCKLITKFDVTFIV